MNCPTCAVTLVIAERQGIEIDYCPQCRGVWLDRGELDKIVDRSEPRSPDVALAAHRAPEYKGDHGRHYESRSEKPYKKKRESFLGELFDF